MTTIEVREMIYEYMKEKGFTTNNFDAQLVRNNNYVNYKDQGGEIHILCTSHSIFYEERPYNEEIIRNCFATFEEFVEFFEELHMVE